MSDAMVKTVTHVIEILAQNSWASQRRIYRDRTTSLSAELLSHLSYRAAEWATSDLFWNLVLAICKSKSDVYIWHTILCLLSENYRSTSQPLSSSESSPNSRLERLTSHLRPAPEYESIKAEIRYRSYIDAEGFYEKYFAGVSWSATCDKIFKSIEWQHHQGLRSYFPAEKNHDAVFQWFLDFQNKFLGNGQSSYFYTKSRTIMRHLGVTQNPILVMASDVSIRNRTYDWVDVRVIGLYTLPSESDDTFYQLAKCARWVFHAQPLRLFLHCFIISNLQITLHIFDRHGNYSAPTFDILENPRQFLQVIISYCFFSDRQLGLDTFVEHLTTGRSITIKGQDNRLARLQLEDTPIYHRRALISRASSCYRTIDQKCVVKFSWNLCVGLSEVRCLEMANEKGVLNVPHLVGYAEIASMRQLRSRLSLTTFRHFEGIDLTASRAVAAECEKRIDRLLRCQVTSPVGRPLHTVRSALELLRVMRDAIKGHRSLVLDGGLLHNDVSEGNIVVTDPNWNNGYYGMLIDYEMATIISGSSFPAVVAKAKMGTLKYVALEILQGSLVPDQPEIRYTYRHDLESFFYVFVSMCIKSSAEGSDPLQAWQIGEIWSIAYAKSQQMLPRNFRREITNKFRLEYENLTDLAGKWRDVLFLTDDVLQVGTPAEPPEQLYDAIIDAFESEIQRHQSLRFKW